MEIDGWVEVGRVVIEKCSYIFNLRMLFLGNILKKYIIQIIKEKNMFDKKMKMLLGVSMIGCFALLSPTQVFGGCTQKTTEPRCLKNPFCKWTWDIPFEEGGRCLSQIGGFTSYEKCRKFKYAKCVEERATCFWDTSKLTGKCKPL